MRILTIITILFTIIGLGSFVQPVQPPTVDDLQYLIEAPKAAKDYETAIPIKDIEKARIFGMLLYHMPNSCASCHPVNKGGQPQQDLQFALGRGGKFDVMSKRHGKDIGVDVQNMKTPEVINAKFLTNALWGGQGGMGGFNSDLSRDSCIAMNENNAYGFSGGFTQMFTAQGEDAHNIGAQVERIRKDTFFQRLADEAFFTHEINLLVSASAMWIYEQDILPLESNFQKWLRYEGQLKHPEGYQLFKKNCTQCHSGPAFGGEMMSAQISTSCDFEGRGGMVKVPQLYQKKDAQTFFSCSEDMTLYKANKAHDQGLKRNVVREITRFVRDDLYDPNLERYEEY